MKTSQLEHWRGEFGTAYTDRNVVDWQQRVEPWRAMVGDLVVRRVLEVGCNRGHNLVALRQVFGPEAEIVGVEPNPHALGIARSAAKTVVEGDIFALPFEDGHFDLVFTSGVLIHIDSCDLGVALAELNRVSGRYQVAIEYFGEEDAQIPYRGHEDLLWKRNFPRHIFAANPQWRTIREGYWSANSPFNDANWWVFEKPRSY